MKSKFILPALLPALFAWSFIAFAAVDSHTCQSLADSNCSIHNDDSSKSASSAKSKAPVSMLKKSDLTTDENPPVVQKDQSKNKGLANKGMTETLELQKRVDDLTRQNLINNTSLNDKLRTQLGEAERLGR